MNNSWRRILAIGYGARCALCRCAATSQGTNFGYLDDALRELASFDERKSRQIELKDFGGGGDRRNPRNFPLHRPPPIADADGLVARLIMDRETGQSRGFGFNVSEGNAAIKGLHGKDKGAANSRLMRLAQKMIVAGALLLDRVANSHLHHLAPLRSNNFFRPPWMKESDIFPRDRISRTMVAVKLAGS